MMRSCDLRKICLTIEQLSLLRRYEDNLRSKRFRRVWEQRKTEEQGFRYFACAENGARAKNRTVGVGEGKEGTACGQTPGFWKLPFAGERGSWLAGLVEHFWHVSIKGPFRSLFTKSVNFSRGMSF